MARQCAVIILFVALCGCGGAPESALQEEQLVSISVTVKAKGRPVELDSIILYTPEGVGAASEIPSSGAISTRVVPGTYKVVVVPAAESGAAKKLVTDKYKDPAQTPLEIMVSSSGQKFDLQIE